MSSSGVEHGEEIQEGKARCPGTQEEKDDEGDAGEEEKETGVKARARSNRSVAAALGRFRRQDQRSIVPSPQAVTPPQHGAPVKSRRPHACAFESKLSTHARSECALTATIQNIRPATAFAYSTLIKNRPTIRVAAPALAPGRPLSARQVPSCSNQRSIKFGITEVAHENRYSE